DEFWSESSRQSWWEEYLPIPAEAVPWLIRLCDNRQRLLVDRRRALPAVRFVRGEAEEGACGQTLGPIVFEREMMRRLELESRKCPDCGQRSLEPGKQYCARCRI